MSRGNILSREAQDDFQLRYLLQTRERAITLFAALALVFAAAPLYRGLLFGPAAVPNLAVSVAEWFLIVPGALIAAIVRIWPRSPETQVNVTLAAIVMVACGIMALTAAWHAEGVVFPPQATGLVLVAVLALSGLPQRRLLPVVLPLFAADAAFAYRSGVPMSAHAQAAGDLLMAALGLALGSHAERMAEQAWLETRRSEQNAREDRLTGLPNRQSFEGRALAALAQAQRDQGGLALGWISVDRMTAFAEHYGSTAAEGALIRIADALRRTARRPLDAVSRAEDGFAVLWYDVDADGAVERANALMEAVRALDIAHRHSPADCMTVSLGLAWFDAPPGGTPVSFDEAMQAAQRALQQAQQAGLNRAVTLRWTRGATPGWDQALD